MKYHSQTAQVTAEIIPMKIESEENKIEVEHEEVFTIEKNVAIPAARIKRTHFPFERMTCSDTHQDSFFVPETHPRFKQLSSSANYYGKKNAMTFKVLTQVEFGKKGQRCWRIK